MQNKKRVERATELYENGHNCAQASLVAFSDLLEYSETELYKMAEGFGGGFGGYEGTCGAISGVALALSLLLSNGDPTNTSKRETYLYTKELFDRFVALFGTSVCKELRKTEGPEQKRQCGEYVKMSVQIGSELLQHRLGLENLL